MAIKLNNNTIINDSRDVENARNLSVTGISTFNGGPILIGSGTSTGTLSQRLQINGGLYASGNLGIGTTNPTSSLHVIGSGNFTNTLTSSLFVGAGTIPIGGIIMWSGTISNIPTGWALCNGSNGTPNLTDKFIVCATTGSGDGTVSTSGPGFNATSGALNSSYTPGNSGGETSHQLSILEMPSHTHSFTAVIDVDTKNNEDDTPNNTFDEADRQTTSTTGSTGGNQYHENRPPYYALAFIMRTV